MQVEALRTSHLQHGQQALIVVLRQMRLLVRRPRLRQKGVQQGGQLDFRFLK